MSGVRGVEFDPSHWCDTFGLGNKLFDAGLKGEVTYRFQCETCGQKHRVTYNTSSGNGSASSIGGPSRRWLREGRRAVRDALSEGTA
jgi:hypothetical protein